MTTRPRLGFAVSSVLFCAIGLAGTSAALAGPSGWVINEVLADPGTSNGDANGNGVINTSEDEFIEIVNLTGADQDISGWSIHDAVGPRHTFPPGTLVADNCAVVVFGDGPIGLQFNGAVLQTASTGMLGFNNSGDSIALKNLEALDQATFTYSDEGGMDQSMTRDPDLDGDFVLHTQASTADGALYSPGTFADGSLFEGCPDEPPEPMDTGWVINEILADPDPDDGDANGDGNVDTTEDEFVEILNLGDEDRDISGWTLSDGAGVQHIFLPGTVVPAECAIVVFGGGTVGFEFNGALTQIATTGGLGLNNGGDSLTLADDQAAPQAIASYGEEGASDQSLVRDPEGTGDFVLHGAVVDGVAQSPGTRSDGSPFSGCPDEPVEPPSTEIWEIQGSGSSSGMEGVVLLTVDNIVIGVTENGFYLQTPEERSDNDDSTSDGIFVFTGETPAVELGDLVDVAGEVDEFFDLTELVSPTVILKERGVPLPDPVVFDEQTPAREQPVPENDLERYEGMRVQFSGVVTGASNQFGEILVVTGAERAFREPGIAFPGAPNLPIWDGNPEIFEVDPDALGLPNLSLPAGAIIDNCVGPLSYRFGDYQVRPTELVTRGETEVRPVRAPASSELTIATLNLFNLTDATDDPAVDEDVVDPIEYSRRLSKHSLLIRDVLQSPDILTVQEVENLAVLEQLATTITEDDSGIVYTASLIPGNDPGGRNIGFLTRDSVEIGSVTQAGAEETFEIDGRSNDVFARPPLILDAVYTAGDEDYAVTVVGLHLRSLIDIEDSEFVQRKRLEQARFVAQTVHTMQDLDSDRRIIITGDFNGFEFSDGFVDVVGIIAGTEMPGEALLGGAVVVEPPLRNRLLDLPEEERYSTVHDGNAQAVDHMLTNENVDAAVTGIAFGRAGADVPRSFNGEGGTALGASDHDGLVLYLRVGEPVDTQFIRGDFDTSGDLSLTDAVGILNFLFLGGPISSCAATSDANADGNVDLSDGVGVLGFLFLGLPAPPAPFPECGLDPETALSCDSFPGC